MTVIAWDGKTLAADGRMTEGTSIYNDDVIKLFELNSLSYNNDRLLYAGVCGDVSCIQEYLVWLNLNAGIMFKEIVRNPELDVAGLIIGVNKAYIITQNSAYLMEFCRDTKLAEGSGSNYALSAMSFSLNAVQAVEHACSMDSSCGGSINSVGL